MKIAMIVERFPPDIGGSGTRFYKIAEHLSQKKYDIDVFTIGSAQPQIKKHNFNIYRLNLRKLALLPFFESFNRVAFLSFSTFLQFLFRSYDLIDVDVWPFLHFFLAKIAKPKIPIVVSWNVVWPFSYKRPISKINEILAYAISKLGTYNITVSNFAKKTLQERLGICSEKIEVIPNGIDEEFFKVNLEPQVGRIIFVGRLEPQKRLDLTLTAFKIFREKVSSAEFHIIGSGPLYMYLVKMSKKIDGVHLHGFIPVEKKEELISQLKKSWVFVSASEFESYGLSIAESLSMGLPVLVTKTPYNAAINEFVRHNYNGLIVEHNKPIAIANALEKLYIDQKLWIKLSENAKRSHFSTWNDVARKVGEVYKKLIE
ncbi:MAG: glycosyltransferase family 4 protein [Candidatus Bathyarchaeia archaeon]